MSAGLRRREFLLGSLAVAASTVLRPPPLFAKRVEKMTRPDPTSTIFRSVGGSPEDNLEKVLEISGGIARLVEEDAVVVVKPNVQWWNQGAPHLGVLRRIVDSIMSRPGGFAGEVVIAENCHRGAEPDKSAGWSRMFSRNSVDGLRHMGDLVVELKKRYGNRFSVRHWVDVDAGAGRVFHAGEGTGYVYCDGTGGVPLLACGNDQHGEKKRRTIMTYPIFTTDRGTVIDFKHGVWKGGGCTDQPVRFINMAALNHHSTYCGMTSAIKNYLGVVDLSGGADPQKGGRLCGDYYNFHSFPFDHWGEGPQPGMLGRSVGTFMATVRRADLNITTAEWVGLVSRVNPPVARTRAVLASVDPVALDYHAAKYILFPHSGIRAHDPDWETGPLWNDLKECAAAMGGTLDETKVEVRSYDFLEKRFQADHEMVVPAAITWGRDPKTLFKYAYLRMFH